jgi:two-component system KDP operon response regulator KdpE
MNEQLRIIVVDDEVEIRRFLRASLAAHGNTIFEAGCGQDALRLAADQRPDLLILDLGLPDIDGVEITRRIREWSRLPIIILSVRNQEVDKIEALDAGADDYLTKPFSVGELLARIRVALRHAATLAAGKGQETTLFQAGELRVDTARRQVFVAGRETRLTPIEYKLLLTLVHFAGRVVTHRHLLQEAWGPAYTGQTQYVRIYMARLRHKLEEDPSRPRLLLTEPGVGYRLQEP